MLGRLLFSVSVLVAIVLPVSADGPVEVVHRLADAIRKGDKEVLARFYATLKDRPLELNWIESAAALRERNFISPTWCFDSKTNGDAGVVIVGSLKRGRR